MKKIAFLLAPGFEEIEFAAPYDILNRLGCEVISVGVESEEVVGQQGLTVKADIAISALDAESIDILVLPGGKGAWVLRDNDAVIELVKKMSAAEKYVCAICAAPIVLAKAGVIDGVPVSAFPAEAVFADLKMAQVTGDAVTVSGKIVTAKGPGAALAFGYKIAGLFVKKEEVAALKKAMLYAE